MDPDAKSADVNGEPRLPGWLAALAVAGVLLGFVARVRGAWADLVLDLDTDDILGRVYRVLGGDLFQHGHFVTPTEIHLGPLWNLLVAGSLLGGGGANARAWGLLVALDVALILAAAWVLARTLGRYAAVAFVAILLSDPLYLSEQAHPFWYQSHSMGWLALAAACWVAAATSGGAAYVIVGALCTALAAQIHAMSWALIPVGVLAVLLARRALSFEAVLWSAVAFIVTASPLLRQIPSHLGSEHWYGMFERVQDNAERADSWGSFLALYQVVFSRVTGGVIVIPISLALAVSAARDRADRARRSTALLALAWLLVFGAIVAMTWHRFYDRYGLGALVPLALLVAVATRQLAHRSRVLAGAMIALYAARPAWDYPSVIEPGALPWSFLRLQEQAMQRLVEVGASQADLSGGARSRVHGLPMLWPQVVALDVFQTRVAGVLPPTRAGAGGAPLLFHVLWPELRVVTSLDCVTVVTPPGRVQLALDCPEGAWVHVLRRVPYGTPPPPGWHGSSLELVSGVEQQLLVREVDPVPTQEALTMPPAGALSDVFVASAPWTLTDLGLARLPER